MFSRATNAPVRMNEGTKKGRRRPKIILLVVKKDMSIKKVTKIMTLNRIEWRKRIHLVNPN